MIVQPTCSQIEIATDCSGDVEIVQERAWNEDCETTIVISRGHAGLAARAILDAAGLHDVQFYRQKPGGLCYDYDPLEDVEAPGCGSDREPQSEAKDRTAAERQRRYRQKKRNGKTVTPDRNANRDASVTEGAPLLCAAE